MEKTSAQQSYLQYLRSKLAAQGEFQKEAYGIPGARNLSPAEAAIMRAKSTEALKTPEGKASAQMVQDILNKESSSCASKALAKHKKKKATIVKDAQGPMLIDPDTQKRLFEHNRASMGLAGTMLGAGTGLLGGSGLGAGIGALVAGAGKRLRGSGYGALAGASIGSTLGTILGGPLGERAAKGVTQKDIQALNQLAQQEVMGAGFNPYGVQASATFGKNTGDERPFALEDYYYKQ